MYYKFMELHTNYLCTITSYVIFTDCTGCFVFLNFSFIVKISLGIFLPKKYRNHCKVKPVSLFCFFPFLIRNA